MEYANSRKNKIEMIQRTIQQLIESKQPHLLTHDSDDRQLLTNLLSQLEALKDDGVIDPPEPETEPEELAACNGHESQTEDKMDDSDEIVKELKKLEKQNRVTHWLLSALIVVTVAWQLSEVSLLFKLREGVTHPFKSFSNMFKGIIKPRRRNNEEEQSIVPYFELPDLVTSGEKE
ncbi:hypothetical protein vseg_020100 [Gypsophila vaccaria]